MSNANLKSILRELREDVRIPESERYLAAKILEDLVLLAARDLVGKNVKQDMALAKLAAQQLSAAVRNRVEKSFSAMVEKVGSFLIGQILPTLPPTAG